MFPLRPIPVHVAGLPSEGRRFALSFSPEEVGAALSAAGWMEVSPAAPLEAEARVFPSGADVFVLGRLTTRVEYRCVRCLATFQAPVTGDFHVALVRERGAGPGEWELRREDLDVEVISSDTVDLSAVVSEQFFLELDPHPVCGPACRGLCPRCGADRNRADCGCSDARSRRPFEVLEAWGKACRS